MSTELVDVVLDETASRGETLTIHDLLRLIERFDTGVGVSDDRLDSYVRALGAGKFNESALRDGLNTRLVNADEWESETAVYEVDDRISAFPLRWHEDLAGVTDLTRYVATMTAAVDGGSEGYAHGGHGDGVPATDVDGVDDRRVADGFREQVGQFAHTSGVPAPQYKRV